MGIKKTHINTQNMSWTEIAEVILKSPGPPSGYYNGIFVMICLFAGLACVALLGKYVMWREDQIEEQDSIAETQQNSDVEANATVKTSSFNLLRRELYAAPTTSWIDLGV